MAGPGGCHGKCDVCRSYVRCAVCNFVIMSIRHRDIKFENVTPEDIHACYRCGLVVCAECKPKAPSLDAYLYKYGVCPGCDEALRARLGVKPKAEGGGA